MPCITAQTLISFLRSPLILPLFFKLYKYFYNVWLLLNTLALGKFSALLHLSLRYANHFGDAIHCIFVSSFSLSRCGASRCHQLTVFLNAVFNHLSLYYDNTARDIYSIPRVVMNGRNEHAVPFLPVAEHTASRHLS